MKANRMVNPGAFTRNFQEKSRKRMLEMIKDGAAVVLVSHDMNTVRDLATRAIWLEGGKVKMSGNPEDIVKAYENYN